jgi:hypothetical protein
VGPRPRIETSPRRSPLALASTRRAAASPRCAEDEDMDAATADPRHARRTRERGRELVESADAARAPRPDQDPRLNMLRTCGTRSNKPSRPPTTSWSSIANGRYRATGSGRRLSGRPTFVFARPYQTGSSACSWTAHPRGHWATTSCTCQGAAARNASTPCVAPSKRSLRHADEGQLPTCSPLWSAGSSRTERMLPAGSVNQAIVGPLPRMMPLASVLRSGRS